MDAEGRETTAMHCRNCFNEIIRDDAGGWLHQWTLSPYCPERLAEPDPSEMVS